MSPSLTVNHPVNLTQRNAYLVSKSLLGHITKRVSDSNLTYQVFRKLMERELFPFRLASFLKLVVVVVALRAKKEVLRIHARWVIALVKNMKSFWNWAVVDLPGNSMGVIKSSHPFHTLFQTSVTTMKLSDPQPAVSSCFHFVPEPIDDFVRKRYGLRGFGMLNHIVFSGGRFLQGTGLRAITFARIWKIFNPTN